MIEAPTAATAKRAVVASVNRRRRGRARGEAAISQSAGAAGGRS